MKTVYYAHFMGIYNTPQERRDIKTLEDLGFKVVNPNNKDISKEFFDLLAKQDGSDKGYKKAFDYVFGHLVRKCDIFAFKALPDGRIPGGVFMELKEAQKQGKLIIELPSGTHSRGMGKEDTREYLRDIGER